MIKSKFWVLISLSILFLFTNIYAGDFEFGTPTFLTVNAVAGATLPSPMHKCVIGMNDSAKWHVVQPNISMFYSANSGSSWDSIEVTKDNFRMDYHCALAVLNDSVMLHGYLAASNYGAVKVYNGTTSTLGVQQICDTTDSQRGGAVGDTVDNRYWWAVWHHQGAMYDHTSSYWYTDSIGNSVWNTDFIVDINDNGRVGAFDWIGGYPSFVTLDYAPAVYRHEWNGSAIVGHDDSLIYTPTSTANERAFSCDGIVTDDDTLFFYVHGVDSFLVAHWKSYDGGTGSYNVDTLATTPYGSDLFGSELYNASMIVNNKFCIFYANQTTADDSSTQYLYMRAFDPSDSTWTTADMVTQGYSNQGYVIEPNTVANAYCRQGFLVWINNGDSVFYVTITDTASGEPASASVSYRRRRILCE